MSPAISKDSMSWRDEKDGASNTAQAAFLKQKQTSPNQHRIYFAGTQDRKQTTLLQQTTASGCPGAQSICTSHQHAEARCGNVNSSPDCEQSLHSLMQLDSARISVVVEVSAKLVQV